MFITLILTSCDDDDFSIIYEYTGLEAKNAHNLGERPVVTNWDTIPANTYTIQLAVFPVVVAEGDYHVTDPERYPRNVKSIDSIAITSSSNFNVEYPAGTNLNELFIVFNESYFCTTSVNSFNFHRRCAEDYKDNPITEFIDLMLIGSPSEENEYVFTIDFYFSDDSSFSANTPKVVLTI